MQIAEISNKVNKLGVAWEEFKSVNDRKLDELEKKGRADPLFDQQLSRINNEINSQKSRLDNMEVLVARGNLGEASHNEEPEFEYKQAFGDYLKKGNDKALSLIEAKSLSSMSDPEGGYLIRPSLTNNMIKMILDLSPFRDLASVETISTDSLDIIEDIENLSSGWTQESAVRSDSETPKFSKKKISVHEMYAQPKATQKLIDDSSIDIEKWLNEKLANSFAATENEAFINGDGLSMPKGILKYNDGRNWGEIEQLKSVDLKADDLIRLYFKLNENYSSKGTFLMNRFTLEQARALKYKESGKYIWTPGLGVAAPDLLLGAPVKTMANMPVAAKGNIAVAFADFKAAYKIVDRTGIRVLRDPFTDKPFVKFYATKRVGGDVVNSEAIKLLKIE